MRKTALLILVLAAALLPYRAADAATRSTVTATVSKSTATLGTWVKVSGAIGPKVAGTQIQLLEKNGSRWVKVAGRRATASGGYTFWYRPTRAGRVTLRVLKVATKRVSAAYSAPVGVTVYRWISLASLEAHDETNMDTGLETINGTQYKGTIYGSSYPSFIEYNINRRCTKVTGVAGLLDNSETGSRGDITVSGDTVPLYNAAFAVGESRPISVNMLGVLRLRIDTEGHLAGIQLDAHPALGAARVFCTF